MKVMSEAAELLQNYYGKLKERKLCIKQIFFSYAHLIIEIKTLLYYEIDNLQIVIKHCLNVVQVLVFKLF